MTIFTPSIIGLTSVNTENINIDNNSITALASNIEQVSYADISQNNVQYSQDFGNAYWTKNNSSIVSNTVTAPDGTTTADQLIEDSSTGTGHNFNRPNINLPIQYTNGVGVSCYVKSNTRSSFLLGWGTNSSSIDIRAIFNLSTGVITSTNPYGLTMVTQLLDVGSGWYRATFHVATIYPANRGFFLGLVDSSGNYVYDGDGTSGIYIWGAQLELDEPTVSTYLPTTTTEPLYGLTDVTRGTNGTTAVTASSGDPITVGSVSTTLSAAITATQDYIKVTSVSGMAATGSAAVGNSNIDLNLASSGTGAVNVPSAKVMMTSLPTADPTTAGQLWNDSGTLKISAG
jgi:hypothetical protein